MVGTAFLGFGEKFIALLKSVDDVVYEPFRLGLALHSLVFKRKESITYALENIVPGINNVIRIIKNKRRILRLLFQRSNKLFFIKILDVTAGDCGMLSFVLLHALVFSCHNGW